MSHASNPYNSAIFVLQFIQLNYLSYYVKCQELFSNSYNSTIFVIPSNVKNCFPIHTTQLSFLLCQMSKIVVQFILSTSIHTTHNNFKCARSQLYITFCLEDPCLHIASYTCQNNKSHLP